jgi:hypothetical protein
MKEFPVCSISQALNYHIWNRETESFSIIPFHATQKTSYKKPQVFNEQIYQIYFLIISVKHIFLAFFQHNVN